MKGKINFIIDALMFLLLAAVTGLGLLMKYVLIPGRERIAKFGQHVHPQLMGLDRHEWGTMHLIFGVVLLILLVFHIILHWKLIQCLFRSLIGRKHWRAPILLIFSILSLFLLLFPFVIKIDMTSTGARQASRQQVSRSLSMDITEKEHGLTTVAGLEHQQSHAHGETRIRVTGSMTLSQVSEKHEIPISNILSGLGIQDSISPQVKMGRLRNQYGFRMSDVVHLIQQFKITQTK